jgi:hypothetical protein
MGMKIQKNIKSNEISAREDAQPTSVFHAAEEYSIIFDARMFL